MQSSYDVIVAGGGPAGASASWHLAKAGARVICLDKSTFPREKPCGDGITPRAIKMICEMGLAAEIEKFHRIDTIRLVAHEKTWERPIPKRRGLPDFACVVSRSELDEMLLRTAERAGAEVIEDSRVSGPIVDKGVVTGVRASIDGVDEEVHAPIVIGADGVSSRIGRGADMVPPTDFPFALLVRAQIPADIAEDSAMSMYPDIRYRGKSLPGYGWVFPMGDGRINVGLGYVTTMRGWRSVNINECLVEFLKSLPDKWNLPSIQTIRSGGMLNGWRLSTGLAVWPPWKPGVLLVGDAAGVAKPFTGAGISRALQSGHFAAATALKALEVGDPRDLHAYADQLQKEWGSYYRLGRCCLLYTSRCV